MSDPSTGAYAPDNFHGEDSSRAEQVAGQAGEVAGQAVTEVKDTATAQAQRVGAEAKTQVRNVTADVRDKLGEQARTQNDRLVGSIRDTADQLDVMRGDRGDSPATVVVSRVADGGRQLADYLDRNGPEGVLQEVQDFARRRPGAFLATALAAGFVVGRLGKSVGKADPAAGRDKPVSDSFVSTPQSSPSAAGAGYPPSDLAAAAGAGGDFVGTGTEYAATGTGMPVVVEQDDLVEERRR